ncbi:MAG: hypothetical protein JWL57_3364, partial [Actinobacteria bacterium]|nr:hypothetical protein [Actinomycetota bacterium]MCW3045206.1 hypothetical protein [Actinomycetota bacterium]
NYSPSTSGIDEVEIAIDQPEN